MNVDITQLNFDGFPVDILKLSGEPFLVLIWQLYDEHKPLGLFVEGSYRFGGGYNVHNWSPERTNYLLEEQVPDPRTMQVLGRGSGRYFQRGGTMFRAEERTR